jgi:predicted N-formylglutamate amidohydrolase
LPYQIGDSGVGTKQSSRKAADGPVFVQNPGAASHIVLVGDHAGCDIPTRLHGLGLPRDEIERHIGWDLGVGALGAALAERLDAVFVAQRVSRLVIDCNRDPERPDAVPAVSDGTPIPGNADVSGDERTRRVREVFAPYHARIAHELEARAGRAPVLVALHSFTPVMNGRARPWRYGVLHLGASPLSACVLAGLRARLGEPLVGDNEPYMMDGTDYTVPHHAVGRGLDYVELEVRQDLLADAAGVADAAALIADVLEEALQPAPSASST